MKTILMIIIEIHTVPSRTNLPDALVTGLENKLKINNRCSSKSQYFTI